MGITFKKKGAEEAKAAETKPAPEAKPETKTVSASKTKLTGTAKNTAKAGVEVVKEDKKAGTKETILQASEDTGIEQANQVPGTAVPVVGYGFGFTLNVGDYQSYRANVFLSMPLQNAEEINEGFDAVKEWVDERVKTIHAELSA